jgi:outer membrane lipoprotein SlyB
MNMRLRAKLSVLALPLLIAACTTMPSGPSVMVLPGTGKTFERFHADNFECRNYALASIGGVTPSEAAQQSGVTSAVVGTVVGAAAGAAIGGHEGVGVGAGTGLVVGGLAGAGAAEASGYELQRRYDTAYIQCMYARGHQVPVSGRIYRQSPPSSYSPRPPGVPPPPPGMPPPPPPGVTPP